MYKGPRQLFFNLFHSLSKISFTATPFLWADSVLTKQPPSYKFYSRKCWSWEIDVTILVTGQPCSFIALVNWPSGEEWLAQACPPGPELIKLSSGPCQAEDQNTDEWHPRQGTESPGSQPPVDYHREMGLLRGPGAALPLQLQSVPLETGMSRFAGLQEVSWFSLLRSAHCAWEMLLASNPDYASCCA